MPVGRALMTGLKVLGVSLRVLDDRLEASWRQFYESLVPVGPWCQLGPCGCKCTTFCENAGAGGVFFGNFFGSELLFGLKGRLKRLVASPFTTIRRGLHD